jgi:Asp-tRNA(Asn)/Glu-tRNA(Gln) amidotransferase A subunit family amidase
MTKTQLQLDEDTVTRLRRAAAARRVTPNQLLKALLENIEVVEKRGDPFLGLLADQAELLDEVVAEAMEARRRDALRQSSG